MLQLSSWSNTRTKTSENYFSSILHHPFDVRRGVGATWRYHRAAAQLGLDYHSLGKDAIFTGWVPVRLHLPPPLQLGVVESHRVVVIDPRRLNRPKQPQWQRQRHFPQQVRPKFYAHVRTKRDCHSASSGLKYTKCWTLMTIFVCRKSTTFFD
jgi:hypothetical protein